jgi:AmiR/NasT family two-component response regulator
MGWHLVDAKEISSLLKQAAGQIAAQHNCTLQEADEWMQQEARAKKASLSEVSAAVLAGRTVDYHYDAPV